MSLNNSKIFLDLIITTDSRLAFLARFVIFIVSKESVRPLGHPMRRQTRNNYALDISDAFLSQTAL